MSLSYVKNLSRAGARAAAGDDIEVGGVEYHVLRVVATNQMATVLANNGYPNDPRRKYVVPFSGARQTMFAVCVRTPPK